MGSVPNIVIVAIQFYFGIFRVIKGFMWMSLSTNYAVHYVLQYLNGNLYLLLGGKV